MKLIRMVVCGFVLGFLGVGPLFADSYECSFNPSRMQKGLIPKTLRIDRPDSTRHARITDTITEANGIERVWAEIPVENDKKVTIKWELKNFNVPRLALLTGIRQEIVSVTYRASVYTVTRKIILTATPKAYRIATVRVKGRCKVLH